MIALTHRYIPVHTIVENLGNDKSKALSLFHSLSGCDTTSSTLGRGKKTFWETWSIFPELTKCLLNLLDDPSKIDIEFPVIEKFFVLLYDRSSKIETVSTIITFVVKMRLLQKKLQVNDARRILYKNSLSLELIPPTQAALYQHVKRSVLQGAFIWGRSLEQIQDIPDPTMFGWTLVEDEFQPFWTTLPESSQNISTNRCGCNVSCKGRCKCKGNCTLLCKCEGLCYQI